MLDTHGAEGSRRRERSRVSIASCVVLSAALLAGCCFGGSLPFYDDGAAQEAAVRYLQGHEREVRPAASCLSAPSALALTVVAVSVSHGTSGEELASQVQASVGGCVTALVTVVLIAGVWTAVGATFDADDGSASGTLGDPGVAFEGLHGHHDIFD